MIGPRPCTDCGTTEGAIRMRTRNGDWCRRCWVDAMGSVRAAPRARQCAWWACIQTVETATAPYVKTRDAYYCNEECKERDACERRAVRKREKELEQIRKDRAALNASEPSSPETCLPAPAATRRPGRKSSAKPTSEPSPGTCAASTYADGPRSGASSGACPTPSPESSRSLPETSRTADFVAPTEIELSRVLGNRTVGVEQAGPAVHLGDGRWSVPVSTRMEHRPCGDRVVYREAGAWRVERAAPEVHGANATEVEAIWGVAS